MQSLEENFDNKILHQLAIFYLATNFIQGYTFFYCIASLLIGFFPNSFVLGCGAASFLLEVYVAKLLEKHNFSVDEVIEKRRRERQQEDNFDDENFP